MAKSNKQELSPENQVMTHEMAKARYMTIEKKLVLAEQRIQKILPKGLMANMMIQVCMNSMTKSPKLLECSPTSILGCLLTSAQLGLVPDGITGQAFLVPFFNNKRGVMEAQFIPGYKGLIQLAMRSGQVKRFQARPVMKGDVFDYAMGTTEYIKHKPMGLTEEPEFFYAILEMVNGGMMFDVMTKAQVDQVRDKSKNYMSAVKYKTVEDSIWFKNYAEMGTKTVVRKLAKFAPVSPEFQRALSLEERFEILGKSQDMEQVAIDPEASQEDKLRQTGETIKSNVDDLEFEDIPNSATMADKLSKADQAIKETQNNMQ